MLRKLNREEHIKTRVLWEEIFQEDSNEFLDYYYTCKASENEIYVIEEDGQIVSMLHLNPYQMRVGNKIYHTHYIVAVATKEECRKRGYMRALLEYVMDVMTERGEPFAFLMPAAEAIYKPFGFHYIYEQSQGKMLGKCHKDTGAVYTCATDEDCAEIAAFANEMLKDYEIVTWRDTKYYQTLLAELKSEAGGILLVRQDHELAGVFCYAETGEEQGPRLVIREPLFRGKDLLERAIVQLTGNETESVSLIGYGAERKPMIMARILNPELVETLEGKSVFLNEVV